MLNYCAYIIKFYFGVYRERMRSKVDSEYVHCVLFMRRMYVTAASLTIYYIHPAERAERVYTIAYYCIAETL